MNIPPLLIKLAVEERKQHESVMTHDIYGKGYCMVCDVDLDFYTEWESHLATAVLTKVFEAMQTSAKIVRQVVSEVPS